MTFPTLIPDLPKVAESGVSMCIISVWNKNLELNKTELMECFSNNPDGAGIMYQQDGKVVINKGLMDWDSFWAVAQTIPSDVIRVFHFRIATSGRVSQGICHPFPVCDDYKMMKFTDLVCDMGFAHNGVFSGYTPKDGMKADKSDTMIYNKKVLAALGVDLLRNKAVRNLIQDSTTSRLALLDGQNCYLIGDFVQSKTSRAFYSNQTYKTPKYTTSSYFYPYYGDDCYSTYGDTIDYNKYGVIRIANMNFSDDEMSDIFIAIEDEFNVQCDDFELSNDFKEVYVYYFGVMPATGYIESLALQFKAEQLDVWYDYNAKQDEKEKVVKK